MAKKIVVLGGGTGLSTLLRGLKQFPLDITAVVTVSDDGKSTGRLREEFNIPAVGDIRRVIVSLAETEPLFEQLLNYRFSTCSDLNGHTMGNLLLTALTGIAGSMTDGIESLSKVLNLKGKVLPLTEDNAILMGEMENGQIIEGEHNITFDKQKISRVFYKDNPNINEDVILSIKQADLIVLSMGSIFTSIIPNLLCKEVVEALDNCKADIVYICNMMTQPGETDNFKASDHIKLLNSYLGKKKIKVVLVNNGAINNQILTKYENTEQKDLVVFDKEEMKALGVQIIEDDFVTIEDDTIRHNVVKLGFHIFSFTL